MRFKNWINRYYKCSNKLVNLKKSRVIILIVKVFCLFLVINRNKKLKKKFYIKIYN